MVWFDDSLSSERAKDLRGDIGRAMQLGFNTNFRYRDVVFHVQTEDSGRANPHVITHIFHGGNIIASLKNDYSALLVEVELETAVRKLMETQHKSMLKQLSRGEFDRVIGERLGPEVFCVERAMPAKPLAEFGTGSSSSTDRTPGVAGRGAPAAAAHATAVDAVPVDAVPVDAVAERTAVNPASRETTSGLARVFGDRVVSEKPLDEVVLDYLVENARKRKRQPKS